VNKSNLLPIVPIASTKGSTRSNPWTPTSHEVVIGKDILELLSTSMYVDPMNIYREYVQNAADSIDEARAAGVLRSDAAQVHIAIDPMARTVRIRDNGASVPWSNFAGRLSNLGASKKRGTSARGFRGVGRLAGLGYCQELVFRARAPGESLVSELRWDCRALKSMLRSPGHDKHLTALVQNVVSIRRVDMADAPDRFFEVELIGVIRHRDDRLLNSAAVADYLSQVAPVPFSPRFSFSSKIDAYLQNHLQLGELEIRINQSETPLYRPHRDVIEVDGEVTTTFCDLETRELTGIDGGVAAVAWILHHEYSGALPNKALVKGIRLRTGNIQVGDHTLLEELFPEPRFNSWSVGEVHILDPKILPNGRRDNFEHNVHIDNVLNQLAPVAREIARRCRHSSIARKWVREFELHCEAALESAKAVGRGGLTRASRQSHIDSIAKSQRAMRKVTENRHLDEESRQELSCKAESVEVTIRDLIGNSACPSDPLDSFSPQQRNAYKHIISLIYECSTNRIAAGSLVEKLLARLTEETDSKTKGASSTRPV